MQYARTAYGTNPHAGVNPNDDHGWGGYQWPEGVPASLLATLTFHGKLGDVTVVGRRELMPLVGTLMRITEEKYSYYFHPGWCWSYENRAVTGSTTVPSNHSRGRAFDLNAPNNPYSWTWQSDLPPAVVALWESHGFYWGGRYTGQPTDPMHMEYCEAPATVAAHLAHAQSLIGGTAGEAPNPVPVPTVGDTHITAPGVTVQQVQTALNQHGAQLAVDGDYGPATTAAVKTFQTANGLEPDGIVGPHTWAALQEDDMQDADFARIQKMIDDRLEQFFTKDTITVLGDAMNNPQKYPATRDALALRTLRVASLAGADKSPTVAQIAAAVATAGPGATPQQIAQAVVTELGKELSA